MDAIRTGWAGLAISSLLVAGCATVQPSWTAEVVLAANEDQVRSVVLTVLTEDGYSFEEGEHKGEQIRTGYRQEISTWNWMLVKRFGVGRSKVLVALSPEGDAATRLKIEVIHEGKYSNYVPLFSSWEPHDPPVQQSAENIVRLVKNALGLL